MHCKPVIAVLEMCQTFFVNTDEMDQDRNWSGITFPQNLAFILKSLSGCTAAKE